MKEDSISQNLMDHVGDLGHSTNTDPGTRQKHCRPRTLEQDMSQGGQRRGRRQTPAAQRRHFLRDLFKPSRSRQVQNRQSSAESRQREAPDLFLCGQEAGTKCLRRGCVHAQAPDQPPLKLQTQGTGDTRLPATPFGAAISVAETKHSLHLTPLFQKRPAGGAMGVDVRAGCAPCPHPAAPGGRASRRRPLHSLLRWRRDWAIRSVLQVWAHRAPCPTS